MHDSVLKRIWQPIDDAYALAERSMVHAWNDADEATMRLQYWLRFGVSTPPWLALSNLQFAVIRLEQFVSLPEQLSDELLIEYTKVALAFKAPMFDDLISYSAYPEPHADRVAAVADAVRTSFVEPEISSVRQDWKCQRSALHQLALNLKTRKFPLSLPGKVIKI